MLESSQTSTPSVKSYSSNSNGNSIQTFPEKNKTAVLKRKVCVESLIVDVMITSECEVIKCQKSEVVNYLNLKTHFQNNSQIVDKENVKFEVVVENDFTIYAVKIHSTLFGIERKSSQLKVLKVLEKVNSVQRAVDSSGEVYVLVTYNDNNQELTKFLDDSLEEFLKNKNSSQMFQSIYESVSKKTAVVMTQLKDLNREVEELGLKLSSRIPAKMLQDVSHNFHLILHTAVTLLFHLTGPKRKIPTRSLRQHMDSRRQRKTRYRRSRLRSKF